MTFNRAHHGRTVLLMLVIMLAQSLVGAVEAGLQSTSPIDIAGHHEAEGIDLSASGVNDSTDAKGLVSGDADEGCDHCCQCHGHCSHLAAAGRPAGLALRPQSNYLPSPRPNHAGVCPPALYRPPIA